MILSDKAIKDLRTEIIRIAGVECSNSLSDEELQEIGILLLTMLSEALKHRVNTWIRL